MDPTPVSRGAHSVGEHCREASHPAARGSAEWRAAAHGRHVAELGAYLDAMAASAFIQRVAERSLAALRLAPGQRLLEVGCGTGAFLPVLAAAMRPGGRVDAIDHSPPFVAAARARVDAAGFAGAVTVQEGDAYYLPFPDSTFDAAHCERVLMHLDDPTAALREMRRVTKRGGVVVAAETHALGTQIDHPDHEAMALLVHEEMVRRIRQPRMGIELHRCMYDAGLERREIVPVVDCAMTYTAIKRAGFEPRETAAALVAEGRLTRERVEALFAYLEARGEAVAGYGCLVIGVARTPE
jgi:ubiquinone/menaquinone biosynthesis C-methylase UbiE